MEKHDSIPNIHVFGVAVFLIPAFLLRVKKLTIKSRLDDFRHLAVSPARSHCPAVTVTIPAAT